MGLDSFLLLAFVFVAIGVVVWRLRSEKSPEGLATFDSSPDLFFVDTFSDSSVDGSSHHVSCESGGAHHGGFGDCSGGHH